MTILGACFCSVSIVVVVIHLRLALPPSPRHPNTPRTTTARRCGRYSRSKAGSGPAGGFLDSVGSHRPGVDGGHWQTHSRPLDCPRLFVRHRHCCNPPFFLLLASVFLLCHKRSSVQRKKKRNGTRGFVRRARIFKTTTVQAVWPVSLTRVTLKVATPSTHDIILALRSYKKERGFGVNVG